MKTLSQYAVLALVLFLLSACGQNAPSTAQANDNGMEPDLTELEVAAIWGDFADAWKTENMDAILARFSTDAINVVPSSLTL